MDLWKAIIVQSPQPVSQEALELVPFLFPIYEFGSEHLRQALDITGEYGEHGLKPWIQMSYGMHQS